VGSQEAISGSREMELLACHRLRGNMMVLCARPRRPPIVLLTDAAERFLSRSP
jgi:hypothetical protein